MTEKQLKVRTSITIDPEVLQIARQCPSSVSSLIEEALLEYFLNHRIAEDAVTVLRARTRGNKARRRELGGDNDQV